LVEWSDYSSVWAQSGIEFPPGIRRLILASPDPLDETKLVDEREEIAEKWIQIACDSMSLPRVPLFIEIAQLQSDWTERATASAAPVLHDTSVFTSTSFCQRVELWVKLQQFRITPLPVETNDIAEIFVDERTCIAILDVYGLQQAYSEQRISMEYQKLLLKYDEVWLICKWDAYASYLKPPRLAGAI
jgi:hypothetical protein